MNGSFFILDTATEEIASMTGKYLSHYNNAWVLSKEPERSAGASGYGAADEWEALYDLQNEAWLPVPEKNISIAAVSANIVDVNVIGSFVDYVVQYRSSGAYQYYRDRNVDGVFSTADYSVYASANYTESILGPYNKSQTYIKQFNNSVMLYPNLRMVILGNEIVSYSYTLNRNRIGTILVPFGDLADDALPSMFSDGGKQYLITKNAAGYIRIMRLGIDVPNRIERMAQYVHRINTVDPVNILIERETRITAEPGSLDWNNKFEIINDAQSQNVQNPSAWHVNSGYNPIYEITGLRSASMIVSNTVFTLYGALSDGGFSLDFINAGIIGYGIDVFYDEVPPPAYKYTIFNGIRRIESRLENLPFPEGVIAPFPAGTKWSMHNEVAAVGEMSRGILAAGMMDGNKTLDLYLFSNQIYFGEDFFVLFGLQYIFDGDYIYQDGVKITMAFGYIFAGCDNNAAYFYNPWDKSIYLFTGSRTLAKVMNLSNRSLVKAGRYDGFSGEMILLTEDEILKNREGIIMNFPYKPGGNITATKKGPYIELDGGNRILLSPINGGIDEFEVITEFIGVDGSTLCDYERIDVRLYSPAKTPLAFTAEMQTINQDTKESEQKRIDLKADDWSSDGYKTIKLIPQYKKGTGLSLRIYSGEEIFIAGIEFTYEPVARTANSQRSGY